jgi:hypothetical protein
MNTTSGWTRRRLIFVGVGGGLALAGLGALGLREARSGPPPSGSALLAAHAGLFDAVSVALLGPALPKDAGERVRELARVRKEAAQLLDNLPAGTRREFADLLTLLGLAPARALLGLSGGWDEGNAPAIAAWLQALRTSSLGVKAQIYFALHDLVYGGFYTEPSTWAASGYPGPPYAAIGLASPLAPRVGRTP